jgi:hypothetical protein
MKKWKKIILYLFFTGLIAGGIVLYKITRPPETAADSKPIKAMTAGELLNELNVNNKLTDSLYKDKNIAIKGKIVEIKDATVFLEAGQNATINCSFDSATFEVCKSTFIIGADADIKGIYSGCDGFDNIPDPDDMLADIVGKNIFLKTCALNKQ